MRDLATMRLFAALSGILALVTNQCGAEEAKIQPLQTPSGVRFGLLGDKPLSPAATIFVFASDIKTTLGNKDYNKAAANLVRHGYLAVALDLPCHGKETKPGEANGLDGWRQRLANGDELVPAFLAKVREVLDYLVREGYTDPQRVVACGTSRGGFIALHFAAAEPRVRCVAAFAPVTDLLALREFAGMDKNAAPKALALANHADRLAGRSVWVCIGNDDQRVNTDETIAFCRKVVAASVVKKQPADVELHVMPVVGHTIHATAHDEVAAWILERIKKDAKGETVEELLDQAKTALEKGQVEKALTFAKKAVEANSKDPRVYLVRGAAHEALQQHADAVADFDKAIALDPKLAEAYDHRGSEQFKLGRIKESIADFDKFLELKPDATPSHWKRGISYYYAGRYKEGAQQFRGYEKVDTNDVENSVWWYLCQAHVVGAEKARESLLKIGHDRRVPLMEVYALFKGEAKPDDVLAAAQAGTPPAGELKSRLFYAHLYLGLYHESQGEDKKAREHMALAAEKYDVGGYMWDVARVHLQLMRRKEK